MSHPSESVHRHGADAHDGHGEADHAHEGTLRGYLTGFVLAAILTIIPFWLVMGHAIESRQVVILVVLGLAVVQIVVHMIYFLHMNTHSESGWNMLALIFTLVLVVIVLGASIWVMYNENANMMPMSPTYMQHSPHA